MRLVAIEKFLMLTMMIFVALSVSASPSGVLLSKDNRTKFLHSLGLLNGDIVQSWRRSHEQAINEFNSDLDLLSFLAFDIGNEDIEIFFHRNDRAHTLKVKESMGGRGLRLAQNYKGQCIEIIKKWFKYIFYEDDRCIFVNPEKGDQSNYRFTAFLVKAQALASLGRDIDSHNLLQLLLHNSDGYQKKASVLSLASAIASLDFLEHYIGELDAWWIGSKLRGDEEQLFLDTALSFSQRYSSEGDYARSISLMMYFFSRYAHKPSLDAKVFYFMGSVNYKMKNYSESIFYWIKSLKNYYRTQDSSQQAEVHYLIGRGYRVTRDYERSLQHLAAALSIVNNQNLRHDLQAKIAYNMAASLDKSGLAVDSLDLYHRFVGIRVLEEGENAKIYNSLEAIADRYIGRDEVDLATSYYRWAIDNALIYYPCSKKSSKLASEIAKKMYDLGYTDKSLVFFKLAKEIHKKTGSTSNELAKANMRIGIVERELGQLERSLKSQQAALYLLKKGTRSKELLAKIYLQIGNSLVLMRELEESNLNYRLAQSVCVEFGCKPISEARILGSLGKNALDKGDFILSEMYLKSALDVAHQSSESGAPNVISKIHNNLGINYASRKRYVDAKHHYKQAYRLRCGAKNANRSECGTILNNVGNIAKNLNDYDSAERFYKKALATFNNEFTDADVQYATLSNLGRLFDVRGEFEKSKHFFEKAKELFPVVSFEYDRKARSIRNYASILINEGDYSSATKMLDYALRYAIKTDEYSFEYPLVLHALSIAKWRNNNKARAEHYAKLAVSEAIKRLHQSRSESTVNLFYRDKYKRFFQNLVNQYLENGDIQNAFVQQELLRGIVLMNELKSKNEDLTYEQIDNNYLSEILSTFKDGELGLFYYSRERETVVFSATNQSVSMYQVNIEKTDLKNMVSDYLSTLTDRRKTTEEKNGDDISTILFCKLILPAIKEIEKSKNVIIFPSKILAPLPFGALKGYFDESKKPKYFIEHKPISYAISALSYEAMRSKKNNSPKLKASIFYAPYYPSYRANGVSLGFHERAAFLGENLKDLPSLSHTKKEAASIKEVFGDDTELFSGTDVHKSNLFKSMRYSGIIHIACHGFVDHENPLNSSLVFSYTNDESLQDGSTVLRVRELLDIPKNQVDLVVLSACFTGAGKNYDGEGNLSFARAFQVAGARSVVSTLWSVRDATTAAFMEEFYSSLDLGIDKASSLQKAQIRFIREPIKLDGLDGETVLFDASHPYFWAAFQLTGSLD